MADELSYLNVDGIQMNQLSYKRLVKSIPSSVATLNIKNESVDRKFTGSIVVTPGESPRSYSEDLFLAEGLGFAWLKQLPLELAPLEIRPVLVKVFPRNTPAPSVGKGTIKARGSFDPV